jgi:hypothetical protein
MNSLLRGLSILIVAFVLTSCGEPEKPQPSAIVTQPFRFGGDFNQVGKVSLYPGESCASQIMFVFHSGRSTSVSMAAPFRESKILTDAAHDHSSVRVVGKWRRGKTPGCHYVEATQVEVRKSFW